MTKVLACFSKAEDVDFAENPANATLNAALSALRGEKYVDLFFVDEDSVTYFMTRPGRHYQKFSTKKGCENLNWNERYQPMLYLDLKVSAEEQHKLRRTCETFATLHIPYNLKDSLIYFTFLCAPDKIGLFDVQKIADVQAMILILRECLLPTHPVIHAMKGLNSRSSTVDALFDAINPVAPRILRDPLSKS